MKDNVIYWSKVKKNAIIPTKDDENAGYDIYACFDEDEFIIPAHETKLVPTGIASAISNKYYLQIEERGSTGSKGIKKSAGVIDSGYRGEWFIAITNTNNKNIIISKLDYDNDSETVKNNIIYPYKKAIAQAVIHFVPALESIEIPYEELKKFTSERMDSKLGGSGK